MAGILSKYRDTTASTCTNWSLTNILAAVTNYTGAWTPVTNGLLTAQHFTELKAVADKLTTEISCCGACCLTNGTCNKLLQSACQTLGGTYIGDGTNCADVSCIGACCLPDGTCDQLSQLACESQSGTFKGGAECSDAWQGLDTGGFSTRTVTFRTICDREIRLCQSDNDGSSMAWGVTATLSFDPDPGYPEVSGFTLNHSWDEHHTSTPHLECDSKTISGAVGLWTAVVTMTGYDCCDTITLGLYP